MHFCLMHIRLNYESIVINVASQSILNRVQIKIHFLFHVLIFFLSCCRY